MKLSFQTFCLIFVVTILHLVAITLFAPLTKSASDYFATLDVETMLENGREDLAALRNEEMQLPETSIANEEEWVSEEIDLREPASVKPAAEVGETAEEKVAAALLRKEEEILEENSATVEAETPAVAISEPARGAIADVRILSERVGRPELLVPSGDPQEEANPSKTPDPVTRAEPAHSGAISKTAPSAPRLQIREIRPL
ncbi:MAG: hypothetical protein P1U85_19775 [Verrucomicrobiales bacterium]|jgi:hypothetical protein|nr:hypothetical protein [Verrucomicrobiales bacterium]